MTQSTTPMFLADGGRIMGDVSFGENCSVWFNAVLRGDSAAISLGKDVNVQDNATLHGGVNHPVIVGDGVTIGHNAIVHGCTVGEYSLIGMGSILLNGCKIGKNVLVGAGALVPSGMEIPDGMLVIGSPAKIKRPLTDEETKTVSTPLATT